MAFTNIIDIIYPKNSVYLSISSTSPATLFGGTWSQVSTGVLAAASSNDNGYAKAGSKGGDFKIHNYQLPEHMHNAQAAKIWSEVGDAIWAGFWESNASSGTSWRVLGLGYGNDTTVDSWLFATSIADVAANKKNQDFLPYHYSVNVWVRTA